MSHPISDADQRLAAIDPERSFIVQAPAGSGKTELLTQRILSLLSVVQRPEEILAITFTRKAAAEMRSRLLEALTRARGSRPEKEHEARTWELARAALEQDRKKNWSLLDNPGRLSLQTIDSFNASLVRRMPWITRLGGMPRLAEDPTPLYRSASERVLERLRRADEGQGKGVTLLLEHLDNRLDALRDLIMNMLARRDQWMRHLAGAQGEKAREVLEAALRSLVEAHLGEILSAIPYPIQDDLVALIPFAAVNLAADGKDTPLSRMEAMAAFPGACAEELPAWRAVAELLLTGSGALRKSVTKACGFPAGKQEPCLSMKERMKAVLDWMSGEEEAVAALKRVRQLPPVCYEQGQWQILCALLELLPLAAAELWLVFREEGEVDFAEIALKAQHALGEAENPSELLLRLDASIQHILIDEFQDTSHLQFELLRLLTEGWAPGDGRTLFLVGDPMQSIYRFREAEVGLFLQSRSRGLGTIPLEPLRLCANFRSQRGIVSWVNEAFSLIFPAQEDPARGAVPLSVAEAVHEGFDEQAVTIRPRAAREDNEEALEVVALVRRLRETDPEGTVAILVRSRTHLHHILPRLREAGLKYQAQDIDLLAERQSARDLVSLTRALLHPADRVSWLTLLRAPWCGLSLADLYALCGHSDEPVPALMSRADVLERLSHEGRYRATRVLEVLRRAVRQRGRISLRQMVEGAWIALGGPAVLGESDLEDAGRVLDLLETLNHGGDLLDLEELETALLRLFATADVAADGKLQIMTIHKAKGLEFDAVILPGLGRKPRGSDAPLMRWLDHPEYGLLLGPIHPRDGESRDPIYDTIGRVEREKDELETARLLYVAATRAKKRLFLLGHAPPDREGACRPEAGSLLNILWPVAESHYAALAEEASGMEQCPRAPLFLRRLPLDWSPPLMKPAPLPEEAGSLSPSRLRNEDAGAAVFSGWEGEAARHVGTVIHALLEKIGRGGAEGWTAERVAELESPARRLLGQCGIPSGDLPQALKRVRQALLNAISGETGRWILAHRPDAACEAEISGAIQGKVVHAVIDRTFVDDDGVRWIIDYKTSEPGSGESLTVFLRREVEKYHPQLSSYAELYKMLEPHREVRAAIYFPLADQCAEIPLGPLTSVRNRGGEQLYLFGSQ